MLKAHFKKYQLQFKFNALTSRGGMEFKHGYYLFISDGVDTGIGECSFIEGLSIDNIANYEATLELLCKHIEHEHTEASVNLSHYPSIKAGYEMALLDLKNNGSKILYPSEFIQGKKQIAINGLVWMGTNDFMLQQINQKLQDGFKCIKIKVGAINFDDEIELIKYIRENFSAEQIEIRLDANGAFKENDVFEKLDRLAVFNIHSLEQPVKQGQMELMKTVCATSPIPIALDEELIDLKEITRDELLRLIKPQYIILKPSLLGGFKSCNEWIKQATKHKTHWWATSALESNIGLNAIAQWAFVQGPDIVHGLGTGGLYINNISSPLFINNGHLGYNPLLTWGEV